MGSRHIRPETLEERLVYNTIIWTWPIWLVGGLYFTGPLLGYVLLAICAGRLLGVLPNPSKKHFYIPIGVSFWIVGMAVMAVALIIAHIDFELGIIKLIKSFIGWCKGWALLAVFPLAGALLSVRVAVIYRATGILSLQTLILIPFLLFAGFAGLPQELYVSPLAKLGGAGPEFFDVTIYSIDDTNGSLRWRFFAPWATAAAFYASLGFLFALYERRLFLKSATIISTVFVCWMAGSRSSIVAIPLIFLAVAVVANLHRPRVIVALGLTAVCLVLTMEFLKLIIEDSFDAFTAARAASSRVRATLNNIGYHRWYTEAFWFGHGIVERGPHLVEFMPIGSHHTWYGLLYVKGLVGLVAFAVPLAWSVFELGLKSLRDRVARCALSVVLALAIFAFADNLEIVTYLIWPGLLIIGIGLRRRFCNPYAEWLSRPRDLWEPPWPNTAPARP